MMFMYMCLCINEYIRAVTLYLNHQYRQIRKLFLVFILIILENFILIKHLLIASSSMPTQQRTSWGQTVWHYRLKVSSCQLSMPDKALRHKIFLLTLNSKSKVWNISILALEMYALCLIVSNTFSIIFLPVRTFGWQKWNMGRNLS